MSSTSNRSRKRKEPTRRSERIAKLETQFPHIPDEILVTILSKLPVKSLLRFRCVSKRWGSLITDPKFSLSTPKQQAIVVSRNFSMECFFHLMNDEALSVEVPKPKQLNGRGRRKINRGLTIRGSCNGLVLLSNTEELFLWNPSTRCCKKVLSHKHLATFDRNQNASGLCYDSSTDDYKVVMACWRRSRERDGDKVMVGSFRNKTWTEVCWPYDKRHAKSGPTVNERLHLLVTKSTSDTEESFDLPVGFDQRTNEFVEVPMPQSKQGKPVLGFGALDGCLSLTLGTDWRHLSQIDAEVFVMKKYSDQASWTRLFVISSADIRQRWSIWVPLCLTKNAEVLLLPELPFRTRIAVYNQKLNFWREEQMGPKKIRTYDIKGATFVESLVAPPYYNWEEEEEYTEIFLSGLTKRWKREQGDVAFKVIDS